MYAGYANLIGWGRALPERTVTNAELASVHGLDASWIEQRTGIRERRMVGESESTATLAIEAGREALACARLAPDELDLILVATSTPDHVTPPMSSQVQHGLGAPGVGAMQVTVGCSGFVYALLTAEQFIRTGACTNVLVVGAEVTSRRLDFSDRVTSVLFGDGAGAVVLQATKQPCGSLSTVLGSDGAGGDHLMTPAGGAGTVLTTAQVEAQEHCIRMNGREVYRFATTIFGQALSGVMEQSGIGPEEIDLIVPHQANGRILVRACERIGIPSTKLVLNLDRYGNTSAASVPLALCEALDDGRVQPGMTVALVAFGAGLSWAATLFRVGPMQGGQEEPPARWWQALRTRARAAAQA